jgi:hypothetical protein
LGIIAESPAIIANFGEQAQDLLEAMKDLSRSESTFQTDPQAVAKGSDQNVGFNPSLDPVPDRSEPSPIWRTQELKVR